MPIMTLLEFLKLREDNPELDAAGAVREAPGALKNGTRIEKTAAGPGDAHGLGDRGVILGSLGPVDFEGHPAAYGYFVAWDDVPGVPCFVSSWRIKEVADGKS